MSVCTIASVASAVGVLALTRCEPGREPDDWWVDGSGSAPSVALLNSLDADGRNCDALRVESMDCEFSSDGITVYVRREGNEDATRDLLMVVAFDGMLPGRQLTTATGYLERYVGIGESSCYMGVSTHMSPEPCELELQGILRGQAEDVSNGSGGGTVTIEVGSRVRIRVSCPSGLYYPGADDVSPFWIPIIPSEFALEAQDCVVQE